MPICYDANYMDASIHFIRTLNIHLDNYIIFKQNSGCKYNKEYTVLKNFICFLKNNHIKSYLEINEEFILSWVNRSKKIKGITKNHYLRRVKYFFKYLRRIKEVSYNPTEKIEPFKTTPFIPYIYTIEELKKIFSEIRNRMNYPGNYYRGLTYYTMFFLVYALGLRIGEALRIKIKDINFKEKTIFISKSKFYKERLIPFSKCVHNKLKLFLKERLKQFPKINSAPLFINDWGIICNKIMAGTY